MVLKVVGATFLVLAAAIVFQAIVALTEQEGRPNRDWASRS
jgi:hypothetical protein